MKTINWNVTKKDSKLISKIAKRAVNNYGGDFLNVQMDITATHLNGNPLKLSELLKADEFNFLHDIGGIAKHINRETGKLENCFNPRYSA